MYSPSFPSEPVNWIKYMFKISSFVFYRQKKDMFAIK